MEVRISLKVKADKERTECAVTCDGRRAVVIFMNDEEKTVCLETPQDEDGPLA